MSDPRAVAREIMDGHCGQDCFGACHHYEDTVAAALERERAEAWRRGVEAQMAIWTKVANVAASSGDISHLARSEYHALRRLLDSEASNPNQGDNAS